MRGRSGAGVSWVLVACLLVACRQRRTSQPGVQHSQVGCHAVELQLSPLQLTLGCVLRFSAIYIDCRGALDISKGQLPLLNGWVPCPWVGVLAGACPAGSAGLSGWRRLSRRSSVQVGEDGRRHDGGAGGQAASRAGVHDPHAEPEDARLLRRVAHAHCSGQVGAAARAG